MSWRWSRDRRERELDDEITAHLRMAAEERIAHGERPGEARAAARREFGSDALVREVTRDMWGWAMLISLLEDFRYAARVLCKTPGFTVVAVATLAVGLGLNTAVFSMVNAVMLRSLPYADSGRLISLWEEYRAEQPANMSVSGKPFSDLGAAHRSTVAPANLADYQARSRSFAGLAGVGYAAMNLTGEGAPERIWGESVDPNFLSLLAVQPVQGRDFVRDDAREGAGGVVIIGYDFWQRRLTGDPGVLGRTVHLDRRPYRVIAVLPPGFEPPDQFGLAERIEFLVPAIYPKELLANHGDHEVGVIGRLKPGVSIEAAQAELDAISAQLARQYPQTNRGMRAAIAPLREDMVRNVRSALLVLLGAVGLIVLITCVNVANLLLVRAVSKRHETSVRLALGASRMRIVRQHLAEGLWLSVCGCAAGVLVGSALTRLLVLLAPANIPRLDGAHMDWRVFAVAAALAAATGMIFGVAPAWQASRTDPAQSLKTTGRALGGISQMRWRAGLAVAEISISLVLLVGAGLLLKSFVTVLGVNLGFAPDRVLTLNVNLPETRYHTAVQRLVFFEELERRAASLPGVQAVAFANRMPMRGGWGGGIQVDTDPGHTHDFELQAVSPGYFQTIGVPLLRGRLPGPADRDGRPLIAVVNQAFVHQVFGNANPIGHRLRRHAEAPWLEIAGVVADIRRGGKTAGILPQVYFPAAQTTAYPVNLADFAVRTTVAPRQLIAELRRQVLAIDKDQPVTNVRTLTEIIGASVAQRRFQTALLLLFSAVGLTLSVIGIFGVLSYSVGRRMPEFGIRVALGAEPRRILALVLWQAAVLILLGLAIGAAGALVLTRYLQSLLFQVHPHDWTAYAAAGALLAAVSLLASAIPARRGGSVDPLIALRYE